MLDKYSKKMRKKRAPRANKCGRAFFSHVVFLPAHDRAAPGELRRGPSLPRPVFVRRTPCGAFERPAEMLRIGVGGGTEVQDCAIAEHVVRVFEASVV